MIVSNARVMVYSLSFAVVSVGGSEGRRVGRSVGQSVSRSVGQSVRPSSSPSSPSSRPLRPLRLSVLSASPPSPPLPPANVVTHDRLHVDNRSSIQSFELSHLNTIACYSCDLDSVESNRVGTMR